MTRTPLLALAGAFAVALAVATPASAAAPASHGHTARHATHQTKHEAPKHPSGKHSKCGVGALVTLTGVISDTPTASISDTSTATTASDTATSTITILDKGGACFHAKSVTINTSHATIRRNDAAASASDLRKGDHVSVRGKVTSATAGKYAVTATRVNASGSEDAKPHPETSESAKPTKSTHSS